ncbi:MAG: hypothetical protein K6U77_12145, partial [Armatimonadetes bacterium]|nr:hypothetical protein [Armatimonadota bacterium]
LWSEVLGVWLGVSDAPFLGWRYRWLRFYREDGSLVPTGEEAERQRAEAERLLREQEQQRAEAERQRAEQERLLREQEQQRAERERQRAEQERLLREQAEQRLAELEAELKRLRGEQ